MFAIYFNIGKYKDVFWDIFFYVPFVFSIIGVISMHFKYLKSKIDAISTIIFSSFLLGFFLYFVYAGLASDSYSEYEEYLSSDYGGLEFSSILFIVLLGLYFAINKKNHE